MGRDLNMTEARSKNFVEACDEHDYQSQYEVLIQALHVLIRASYMHHPAPLHA